MGCTREYSIPFIYTGSFYLHRELWEVGPLTSSHFIAMETEVQCCCSSQTVQGEVSRLVLWDLRKMDYSLKIWASGEMLCIWEEGLKYPYLIFNSSIPFWMHPASKSRRVVANLGNGIVRLTFHPRSHSSSQFSLSRQEEGVVGTLGGRVLPTHMLSPA